MVQNLKVESNEGIRLDAFLAGQLADLSRESIKTMISHGSILVNDKKSKPSYRTLTGDVITILDSLNSSCSNLIAENIPLEILYQDDSMAVIVKPAGMLTHPSASKKTGTLVNALLYHLKELSDCGQERPGIVHRLDRDTSGILLIAKTAQAHRNLTDQFRDRVVKKTYLTLVHGRVELDSGEIRLPLKHSNALMRGDVAQGGREALTLFETIEKFNTWSFLRCFPKSGRTHQIRIHLSAIGYPVIGDKIYGPRKQQPEGLEGHLLHAAAIEFKHPSDGRQMTFECSLPGNFRKYYNILKEEI